MENIQLKGKKGMSIGDMYPTVLTILLVGIVMGVGLFVLGTFHDSIATSYAGTQNGINTTTGTTTLTVGALTEVNLTTLTATLTNGSAITNFTYVSTTGVVTWGNDIVDTLGISLVNTTYTYTYDRTGSAEEAVTTTATGLATFADWIAIIVVVIAAAIVLGVVLTSFGRKRNMI